MQDLGIVPKYKTRMEMTYSNKRTSLQHCELNYGCKKFYNLGQCWDKQD